MSPVYEKRLRFQSLRELLQSFRHLSRRSISHTCIYSNGLFPIYTSLVSEISVDGIIFFLKLIPLTSGFFS